MELEILDFNKIPCVQVFRITLQVASIYIFYCSKKGFEALNQVTYAEMKCF